MAEIRSPLGKIRGTLRRVSNSVFRPPTQQGAKEDSVANNLIARNSSLLGGIQKQINTLNQQQAVINKSLSVISKNLVTGSKLEKQRQQAQKAREAKLAAQGLRSAKEAQIEGPLQKALMAPVRAVQVRATSILTKLTRFLMILAGGWLTNNILDIFEANIEGSVERIQEIKKNLLSGFLKAGAVLLLFNPFLGKLVLGATALGFLVDNIANDGILAKPFNFIMEWLKGVTDWFAKEIDAGNIEFNPRNFWFFGNADQKENNNNGSSSNNNAGNKGRLSNPAEQWKDWIDPSNRDESTNQSEEIDTSQADEQSGAIQPNNGIDIEALKAKVENGQELTQAEKDALIEAEGGKDNFYPAMMSEITDQDLLTEIEGKKPLRTDFGPGESGSEEYNAALIEYNETYGQRIKDLRAKINGTQVNSDKLINNNKTNIKERTTNLTSLLASLSDVTPTIVPFPTDTQAAESGASGTVSVPGGTGGSVPVIKSFNRDNSYVYLAYKHYQVAP
tara:strand:+ start:184 stop:1698 length:1515 start_codon:yes stop_codon:yes gene_type:complete